MTLFVTTVSIISVLVIGSLGLIGLINYTINKASKSRAEKLTENHDKLMQEKHFIK